jgi:hypothetical protein
LRLLAVVAAISANGSGTYGTSFFGMTGGGNGAKLML